MLYTEANRILDKSSSMLGNTTDSEAGSMASHVTTLPPVPARLSQSLPIRGFEPEIHKQLNEEHTRAEQHRQNYERLKVQHSRLQEEVAKIQNECRQKSEENRLLYNNLRSTQEQYHKGLLEKNEEITLLRTKVVTPQQLELIRLETYSELEKNYKERYHKLELELEEFKNCCNRQRYELSLLESKCEQQDVQHKNANQELRKKLEAEVNNVRAEKDRLLAQIHTESSKDTEQIFSLKRENVTLQEQLKSALTGLEEAQALREKSSLEIDRLSRLLAKNEVEYNANLKKIEVEKEMLTKEIQKFHEEMYECEIQQTKVSNQKHELEQDNMNLKTKLEQHIQQHKLEMGELKLDLTRQIGDVQRERDKLQNTIEDLKVQLDVSEQANRQHSQNLMDKKKEMTRQVQLAKEKEIQKLNEVENEKLELEAQLQELQRQNSDQINVWQAEKDCLEDKIKDVTDSKNLVEKELLILKAKVDHERSVKEELEQERSDNRALRSQVNSLQAEINHLHLEEHNMSDKCQRLRSSVEKYRSEVKRIEETTKKNDQQTEEQLHKQKHMWKENLERIEKRNEELEKKCKINFERLSAAASIHEKYKKKSLLAIQTLKKKLELKSVKIEELDAMCKIFENWVSPEEHKKLKLQLQDLLYRHNEFRRLVFSAPVVGDKGPLNPILPNNSFHSNFEEQDNCHRKELHQLKDRLEKLDSNQREQLEELQHFISNTPPSAQRSCSNE
ncbi:centrosomal protein of 83 kDa isoform X1 [Octopus bimaculoides]|uniref:Centrosomal protein of 83 kDa n=2 Tax=Octopus bimaculoides TaxID=37653 RepID=A0A0L8H239_OCTBM|nr:centrosomal protein of 83 kDa isoform X1 [Octopus bimaculoides]|eukprot:XP_014776072.1 PREDICTED: centrosomal protein of 83 kDa-like isoform X1 [Octopus bimaculoides]